LIPPSSLLLAALLLTAGSHAASVDPALPLYEPRPVAVSKDAGYATHGREIRVIGYNDMGDILEPLAARFARTHPGLRLKLELPGTRFAPAALAEGRSAFAPMGAEFTPPQLAAYRAIAGSDPIAIRVAHASLDPRALSGPLAILVHRDNPVASLTLEQVGRIFSGEARTWGDVGLGGEWSHREVRAIGMAKGTALAYAFEADAMHGRALGPGVEGRAQSAEVALAVSREPNAVGFAAAMRAIEGTRVVPIAARPGDAPIAPTEEDIVAGRYALDRFLLIFVARPITPLAREFVKLMLSREGQEAVAASPQRYLPLSARDAAVERAKVE
jgi:phosphate transport system substrate-binding protein